MIDEHSGRLLLRLARESIKSCFSEKGVDISEFKEFSERMGVFVSLHLNGELRGCIGFPEPVFPLFEGVLKAAQSAAFEDPRFLPLSEKELEDVKIEVSVLTVPELIEAKSAEEYLNKIEIGRHGLIIKHVGCSGLLLPQVAVEQRWSVKEFLECLCNKAGLGRDEWKSLGVKVYRFEAQVFSE